jgi:hypothetical protein
MGKQRSGKPERSLRRPKTKKLKNKKKNSSQNQCFCSLVVIILCFITGSTLGPFLAPSDNTPASVNDADMDQLRHEVDQIEEKVKNQRLRIEQHLRVSGRMQANICYRSSFLT